MWRAIALLACAVGCKSGNFLTVNVDNIPCGTDKLVVTVALGDASDRDMFSSESAFTDGRSDFAIDLGTHVDGTLVVTVIATNAEHMLATSTQMLALPEHAVVVDLLGQPCSLVDAPTVNLDCWPGIKPPTNFAPCDDPFPKADQTPLNVSGGGMINTDDDPHPLYPFGKAMYRLFHVPEVNIGPGTVTVIGTYPLLIVSDGGVVIDGTIAFSDSQPDADCESIAAPEQSLVAAGGGGAGYATQGANGGSNRNNNIDGAIGGTANGSATLFPLRAGCAGGPGADSGTTRGGAGGFAPGGIQITAVDSISVHGAILANGHGGKAGMVDSGHYGGGGGGASGGSILLEANTVTVAGKVCAVGGGGGQGGLMLLTPNDGQLSPDCTGGAGGGATTGGNGGRGGDDSDPMPGGDALTTAAAGGGGGAAGRIRVHGTLSVSGAIAPTPSL